MSKQKWVSSYHVDEQVDGIDEVDASGTRDDKDPRQQAFTSTLNPDNTRLQRPIRPLIEQLNSCQYFDQSVEKEERRQQTERRERHDADVERFQGYIKRKQTNNKTFLRHFVCRHRQ